jgi:type II secretory pathway component PulK
MQEALAVLLTIAVLVVIASPFALIIFGAIYRAKQHKKVWDAADKYIHS